MGWRSSALKQAKSIRSINLSLYMCTRDRFSFCYSSCFICSLSFSLLVVLLCFCWVPPAPPYALWKYLSLDNLTSHLCCISVLSPRSCNTLTRPVNHVSTLSSVTIMLLCTHVVLQGSWRRWQVGQARALTWDLASSSHEDKADENSSFRHWT